MDFQHYVKMHFSSDVATPFPITLITITFILDVPGTVICICNDVV